MAELPALNCSVCLESYEEEGDLCPKWLPCSHTVCLGCLRHLNQFRQITCPECRALHSVPTRGPEAFRTNRDILELRRIASQLNQVRGKQ